MTSDSGYPLYPGEEFAITSSGRPPSTASPGRSQICLGRANATGKHTRKLLALLFPAVASVIGGPEARAESKAMPASQAPVLRRYLFNALDPGVLAAETVEEAVRDFSDRDALIALIESLNDRGLVDLTSRLAERADELAAGAEEAAGVFLPLASHVSKRQSLLPWGRASLLGSDSHC